MLMSFCIYIYIVALARFRRALKYARLEVRMLTHTFHLSPTASTINSGPQPPPEWLLHILEYLPCLQSLLVSGLPLFDHAAMIGVSAGGTHFYDSVHLLLAQSEPNATPRGLAEALGLFPMLVYLDMSYTLPARDPAVLSVLSQMAYLQVLKLQGLRLKDNDVELLLDAIGGVVRFLDLRDNQLTDVSILSLLHVAFPPVEIPRAYDLDAPEEATGSAAPDMSIWEYLSRPDLDQLLLKMLTRPLVTNSRISNLPHTGVTHLYLAENPISLDGVASLLAAERLYVLDVGTVYDAVEQPDSCAGSGAEKLIPFLVTHARDRLTYLRISHSAVTEDTPVGDNSVRYRPVIQTQQIPDQNEEPDIKKGGPAFAPEAPEEPQKDGTSVSIRSLPAEELASPVSSAAQDEGANSFPELATSSTPAEIIRQLLAKRPAVEQVFTKDGGSQCSSPYLHPSHIPHVETLVVTDVPPYVPEDSQILGSLIRFITACADEAMLANLQAQSHHYALPQGSAHVKAEKMRSKELFALRRLILEIARPSKKMPAQLRSWTPMNYTSGAGDRDVDALRSAATNDFSFFGGEKWGSPQDGESSAFSKMSALNESLERKRSRSSQRRRPSPDQPQRKIDLVAQLAAFRRSKKAQYEGLINRGTNQSVPYVEGYWKGEVNVVRNAMY